MCTMRLKKCLFSGGHASVMWLLTIYVLNVCMTKHLVHAQTENLVMDAPGSYELPYTITVPSTLYPFSNITDHLMPRQSFAFTQLPISRPFPFFNTLYRDIYPNTFGSVTFGNGSRDIPQHIPTSSGFRLIGPYWGHTEPGSCVSSSGQRSRGDIFVRETENPAVLNRATEDIRRSLPSEGHFTAKWAFIMSVYEVRMPGWDCGAEVTTFQLILVTDGGKSFAIFIYHEMGSSWNTCAHVPYGGIDAGDGKNYFLLPQSGTYNSNFSETLVAESNVGRPGHWVYRVDKDEIISYGCGVNGSGLIATPRFGSLLGGTKLIISGICRDSLKPEAYNVTCRFAGIAVSATVTEENVDVVHCISPLGIRLGRVVLEVSLDGGLSYGYNTTYTYEHITTDVVIQNEAELNSGTNTNIRLTWDRSAWPSNVTLMVQLLAWYSRPVLGIDPITTNREFVAQWTVQNEFSAVVIPLQVTPNTGTISVPTSNILGPATSHLVLYAGAIRVIRETDARQSTEMNGYLQQPALYSAVKPLPFLQHVAAPTPLTGAEPVFVKFDEKVQEEYIAYRQLKDCFLTLSQDLAFDAAMSTVSGSTGVDYKQAKKIGQVFLNMKDLVDESAQPFTLAWDLMTCRTENAEQAMQNRGARMRSFVNQQSTQPCPVTKAQALRDVGRYAADPSCREGSFDPSNCIWNQGATHCVLTATTNQGIASQCCYSAAGDFLDAKSETTKGGGQLQIGPFNGYSQQTMGAGRSFADLTNTIFTNVRSTLNLAANGFACGLPTNGALCQKLIRNSAGSGHGDYKPSRPAITFGDPHIATYDGCRYTFNGLGEYVLVELQGIATVQGRTRKTDNGRATVWQAIAIRGTTNTRVHIQYSPTRVVQVFVNDREVDYDEEPETLQIDDLRITRKTNASTVEVVLESGLAVEVTSAGDILDLLIYLPVNTRGWSQGLFGSWDDNVTNDLVTPTGQIYTCNDTTEQLFEFGNTWRVTWMDSLFHYAGSDTYGIINDMGYIPEFTIPVLNATQAEEARVLCGSSSECLFDFTVTGSKKIAQASLKAFETFAQIEKDIRITAVCEKPVLTSAHVLILRGSSFASGDVVQFACSEKSLYKSGDLTTVCTDRGVWTGVPVICSTAAILGRISVTHLLVTVVLMYVVRKIL